MFIGILPLSTHTRTFDDAVVAVYKEKPYLYVGENDCSRTKSRKKVPDPNQKKVEQEEPLLTWQHLEHSIDVCALGYSTWRIYNVYQLIYNDAIKPPVSKEKTLVYLAHCLAQRLIPTWATTANKHRQFCAQATMTLIEIYLYRTAAHYTLMGIRYGIVKPISWIYHGVRTLCLC